MEDGGVVEKKMTENFSKLEDLKTTLMDKSEPDQSESDHDSDSDPDFPKRVIKCKGGYGPPPMIFTYEELTEIFKPQDNGVAEAGLKLLNQRRAADGKSGYELVVAQDSAYFRTKQGLMYHGNFVAKPSDDHNAKNELFLFVCTSVSRVYQAIDCISLGFVDTDDARCRNCEVCRKLDLVSPPFHPSNLDIDHSCRLCDAFGLSSPIFHPSGFKIDHLIIFPTPSPRYKN